MPQQVEAGRLTESTFFSGGIPDAHQVGVVASLLFPPFFAATLTEQDPVEVLSRDFSNAAF